MYTVELVGGPYDGERRNVHILYANLTYDRPREDGRPSTTERLLAGERVPAEDFDAERRGRVVEATYARSEPPRKIKGARVYTYVVPRPQG